MNKVYDVITQTFIEEMEAGHIPWERPWNQTEDQNYKTKSHYSGVNVWILNASKRKQKFTTSFWLTFKQAKSLGGTVKKGSKGTRVIFWKMWEKKSDKPVINSDQGEKNSVKMLPILRFYTVFNADQIEGIEFPEIEARTVPNPVEKAESILRGYEPNGPKIDWSDETRAYYHPAGDYINMPKREYFKSPGGLYETLFHEMTHSTGHKSRLKRHAEGLAVHFGDESYSKEELCAELGSAFLCYEAGIDQDVKKNMTAYLQNWIQALKNDTKMIIEASGKAQKAVNFILNRKKEYKK